MLDQSEECWYGISYAVIMEIHGSHMVQMDKRMNVRYRENVVFKFLFWVIYEYKL